MNNLIISNAPFFFLLFLATIMTQPGLAQNQTLAESYCFLETPGEQKERTNYQWTTNHMHVGVRWQPFVGRPENNAYDATRPVITKHSSYAQFWVGWDAIEPTPANTDYLIHPSSSLQAIETMNGADIDFMINDILIKGARSVRAVYEVDPVYLESTSVTVANETLTVTIPKMNKFTAIEFVNGDPNAQQ